VARRARRSDGESMKVSVCIPATRADGLGQAIRSVCVQTWGEWEAVVLGQGDAAAEAAMRAAMSVAAAGDARVRYVHLAGRGLSRARNAALQEARGEVVAFLDDDCEADPAWLETIVSAFTADPTLGVVGGAVTPKGPVGPLSSCPTLTPAEAVYDPAETPQQAPDGWDWIGANFAIRAVVADRTGAWDVHLGAGAEFPAGEDTDYKLRLESLGVRMLSTPRSLVLHSSGTRSGRAALRSQRNYALGNGALAAKQTLAGDPRGRIWLRQTRRGCLTGWVTGRRPHRFPSDLRRGFWFEVGYRRCLRQFKVDEAGLLRRSGELGQAATGPGRVEGGVSRVPPRPETGRGALRGALAWRLSANVRGDRPLLVPVAGGAAGLVNARGRQRLVSLLDPAAVQPGRRGLRAWLERRQARRSALLLVPDRATGIRFAGRWKLDLVRIRAVPDLGDPPGDLIRRCLAEASVRGRRAKPWHAV